MSPPFATRSTGRVFPPDNAAELAEELARRWSLRLGRRFEGGVVGLVLEAARADGTPVVLKVSAVDRETVHEGAALRHYDGAGAVRLLEADTELGALLLERAEPGWPLISLPEEESNPIAAALLRRLWKPPPAAHPFDLAADRAAEWAETVPREWERLGRPCERRLVDRAAALFRELGPTQDEAVVLHTDFHGLNILAGRREPWLAIDPKPLVGEPAYDAAGLVRDRRGALAADPDLARRLRRRLDFLTAELDLDRERLRGWSLALLVELGLWSLSVGDRTDAERELEIARLLATETA